MSGTLITPKGPHVILNTLGIECGVCKRKGLGNVIHPTITRNCRPVVFTDPDRMEAHVRKVTKTDTHIDTDIIAYAIGTPQAISVVEAEILDPDYLDRPFNK